MKNQRADYLIRLAKAKMDSSKESPMKEKKDIRYDDDFQVRLFENETDLTEANLVKNQPKTESVIFSCFIEEDDTLPFLKPKLNN